MRLMPTVLVCVLAAVGCTEKSRQDPNAAALAAKIRLTSAPKPEHPLDIRFENKIRLLGYDLSEPAPAINRPFKVTWYWQVVDALDSGYQVFTHLSDGKVNRINLDSDRVARRAYPESDWKKGEYIRDEQEVTLPGDWGTSTAVFYLGFYSGETRLKVTGKQDGESRAEALRLELAKPTADARPEKVEPAVPRLIARHTTGAIKLDGKLDEADWKAAQSTGPFVQTMTGDTGAFESRAQVLYDATKLYVGFVVSDDFLKTSFEHNDDHLWEQDTVEVMLDPDGDARNYFELQVSPRGVHFDTRYDSPRQPRPFGHMDWDSQVEAKVQLRGKLNDSGSDEGYTVELAVPWSAFATGEPPAAPPGSGDTWRINFFVMDARKDGQRAVGWSAPKVGDFHTLGQFGRVVFTEAAAASSTTH